VPRSTVPTMSDATDDASRTVSPYATGGGGTVLEHRYGAVLLAHLLTSDPISMLGDDVAPETVMFQASAHSPVDDLVVVGRTPDGAERRISIGVRRAPSLVTSERPSIHLLASYLRVVIDHWGEVAAGRWRLGLAVASPNTATQQVRELSIVARSVPDNTSFRAEVALLAEFPRRSGTGLATWMPWSKLRPGMPAWMRDSTLQSSPGASSPHCERLSCDWRARTKPIGPAPSAVFARRRVTVRRRPPISSSLSSSSSLVATRLRSPYQSSPTEP
jgi:hypothetical protein